MTQMPINGKERKSSQTVSYHIAGRDYEVPAASICSGVEVKPVYRPEDAPVDYDRDLGDPGQFPYTRGVQATMYRTHLWTFRQYAGYGTGEDTNTRFKSLIEGGQNGLSVAFDLPTQLGLDSDDPRAEFEVGRIGVAVDTVDDLDAMFADIDPARISTSFTINATSNIIFAMYLALAEKRGVSWEVLRGTIQNDTLKEFVARGTFVYPPGPSVEMTADALEFAMKHAPKFNAVSVSSTHIKEAGANNAFSIGVSMANGMAYIDAVRRRGYHIDDFGPNISFNLFGDMEFFENICQQRAARRLWAHIMRDRYDARNPKSMQLRYVAGAGSGTSLTHAHPLLNIARLGFHCLMQVLGGTQAVALQSYDEAFAIPSEEAAKLSLLIQAMVAYETGVTDVVDPLGGSYFVENMTNEIEQKINEAISQVEAWGGPIEAIQSGVLQREIALQSYAWQSAVDDGSQVVVGVNKFAPDPEDIQHVPPFEFDVSSRDRQLRNLRAIRDARSNAEVRRTLGVLAQAAESGENLMFPLIDCCRAMATVGEMRQTLVDVHGLFEQPVF